MVTAASAVCATARIAASALTAMHRDAPRMVLQLCFLFVWLRFVCARANCFLRCCLLDRGCGPRVVSQSVFGGARAISRRTAYHKHDLTEVSLSKQTGILKLAMKTNKTNVAALNL